MKILKEIALIVVLSVILVILLSIFKRPPLVPLETSRNAPTCSHLLQHKNDECLYSGSEGEIAVSYEKPFDENGMHAMLTVRATNGEQDQIKIPFGVDRIIKDTQSGEYYVVATNRENAVLHDFDQVIIVTFHNNAGRLGMGTHLTKGYGQYDGNDWLYIPWQSDYSGDVFTTDEFVLQKINRGDKPYEYFWNFGKELVQRADWKEDYRLWGTELDENKNLVLKFGGNCSQTVDQYCAKYVLDEVSRQITSLSNE